jgi:hypothetical protein
MQIMWRNREYYIICQCAVAQFCWCIIRDILEWHMQPTHVEDRYEKNA